MKRQIRDWRHLESLESWNHVNPGINHKQSYYTTIWRRVPPSARGPLQGSWLAPKPISFISSIYTFVKLHWTSVALQVWKVAKIACFSTSHQCGSLGLIWHQQINGGQSKVQSYTLENHQWFEFNTCRIANVYVLNILSYNGIMKYAFFIPYMYWPYTNIHTACQDFQASTPVQISLSSTFTSAKLDKIIGTKKTVLWNQQNLMDFSWQDLRQQPNKKTWMCQFVSLTKFAPNPLKSKLAGSHLLFCSTALVSNTWSKLTNSWHGPSVETYGNLL